MPERMSMLDIVYEHNTLNGFGFVMVEFIGVAVVTLVLGEIALTARSVPWAVASFGVTANALTICVTVIQQMRRGERSNSLIQTYLGPESPAIRRDHPQLSQHTALLTLVAIVPFSLVAWIAALAYSSWRSR